MTLPRFKLPKMRRPSWSARRASTSLDLAGLASFAIGSFVLATWLGWYTVGVDCVVLSLALGPQKGDSE